MECVSNAQPVFIPVSGRPAWALIASLLGGLPVLCGVPLLGGLIVAASILYGPPTKLAAQKTAVAASTSDPAENVTTQSGFSIVFDDRLSDSVDKFESHVKAGAWDKAFRILADLPDDKWSSLLLCKDGFIRPASHRVRDVVLHLSPEGREAYRIFFEAKAKLLFASARKAEKEHDVRIAHDVYDRYFITSVGDDAADLLGDHYFQRGQFAEAARCWQSILDFHPDTNLSEPRILVKRAIALFRAGQIDDYHSVRAQLQRDFPQAKVVLGGREIEAAPYLDGLEGDSKGTPERAPGSLAHSSPVQPSPGQLSPTQKPFAGFAPAADAKPAWRHSFFDEKEWGEIQATVRNQFGSTSASPFVPPTATDGRRLYCNWAGTCVALDVENGKTIWTTSDATGGANRLKENTRRMFASSLNPAQFAISLGNGVVLALAGLPDQSQRFELRAYDADTGRPLWNNGRAASGMGQESFIGAPLIDGSVAFVVTHRPPTDSENPGVARRGRRATAEQRRGQNDLVMRQLDLQSGAEIWSLPLGTPQLQGGENFWGPQYVPIPALLLSGPRLFVLTNNGALLSVDVVRRQLEWAFKYAPPGGTSNPWQRMGSDQQAAPSSYGPIALKDGVLYFKESGSPTLYALEEQGPRVKWKWRDSDFANLVGMDDGDIYLLSNELSAITRKQPQTRWSNFLSVDAQGLGAPRWQPWNSRVYPAGAVRGRQGHRRRAPHLPGRRSGCDRGAGRSRRQSADLRFQPGRDSLSGTVRSLVCVGSRFSRSHRSAQTIMKRHPRRSIMCAMRSVSSLRVRWAICTLSALVVCATANRPVRADSETENVTVTATGTENVQPDVAEIRAGVTGSAALAEDALRKFRENRRRAAESIKKLGIANLALEAGGLAIQSANATTNRMMQMFGNNQGATPPGQVTVTETLTLRLSQIDQMKPGESAEVVSKILDAAKDAGMNLGGSSGGLQSDLVRFRSTKLDHARTAASQHAMEFAPRKALCPGRRARVAAEGTGLGTRNEPHLPAEHGVRHKQPVHVGGDGRNGRERLNRYR